MKDNNRIKYEIKEGFDTLQFKFIYGYNFKDNVKTCKINHKKLINREKRHQLFIENAKAKANQRILRTNKIAP